MNELLEKRRSHGMDYFGKDKKLKKWKFFFFFWKKNLSLKQTLENTEKCFPEIFLKNATKHHKIFSRNYFTTKQTHLGHTWHTTIQSWRNMWNFSLRLFEHLTNFKMTWYNFRNRVILRTKDPDPLKKINHF